MNTKNNSREITMEDVAGSITDLTLEMRTRFEEQDLKITGITAEMREGFKRQDEKIEFLRQSLSEDIDNLAAMTKRSFDALDDRFITRKWFKNLF